MSTTEQDQVVITPLILTYNESPNIARVLDQLSGYHKIVVIDSYSKDNTVEIINSYQNTVCYQRDFDNHTDQWNFGLSKVETEWVLSLDADYVITDELQQEMLDAIMNPGYPGYYIPFKYLVFGKALGASILPPRLALFKRSSATYVQDGHTQMLKLDGDSGHLEHPIWHDDRKPLDRWLWAQTRYAELEVEKLTSKAKSELSFNDKIRKRIVLAPFLVFIYCLVLKRGLFDGWRGWFYAFQRTYAELLLSLKLIERKFLEKN